MCCMKPCAVLIANTNDAIKTDLVGFHRDANREHSVVSTH